MVDSGQNRDDRTLKNFLTNDLPNPNKGKEVVVVDPVSSKAIASPMVDEFPDGGLTAWLVVVGVCVLLETTNTLR